MKNNKGFSVVELIVSFSLTMIIVVILFEIIIYIKELYEKSVTQTELINQQNIITDYIYTDLIEKKPSEIFVCGDNCIGFTYLNGEVKQLKWDESLNIVAYGGYTMGLIKNTVFNSNFSLEDANGNELRGAKICYNNVNNISNSNAYVSIGIPLNNFLFEGKDFGVNLLYTYDVNVTRVNLPLSDNC